MKVEAVIKFYGSAAKAARAIGCPPSSFCHWSSKAGGVISERAAIQFVLASGNKLDLGIDDYKQPKQAA